MASKTSTLLPGGPIDPVRMSELLCLNGKGIGCVRARYTVHASSSNNSNILQSKITHSMIVDHDPEYNLQPGLGVNFI